MASPQEQVNATQEADCNSVDHDYVNVMDNQRDTDITEVSHLLIDEDAEGNGVDTIDLDSPHVITQSPNFSTPDGPSPLDPTQPLITQRVISDSSDNGVHFECSREFCCRRSFLLNAFYLFLGILAFCGLVVLADEIGVNTVETIRRYQHRTKSNHHSNPRHRKISRPYPGPSYFRVPGEQMCHKEVSFYAQNTEKYDFACAIQWSYDVADSLELTCPDGYVLSCLFGASYGTKAPQAMDRQCSEWNLNDDDEGKEGGDDEEMGEYPVLPQAVWEENCVGESQCTLKLGSLGNGEYTCDGNVYYNAVDGVQMEQIDDSQLKEYQTDCMFVAMTVQALCEREE